VDRTAHLKQVLQPQRTRALECHGRVLGLELLLPQEIKEEIKAEMKESSLAREESAVIRITIPFFFSFCRLFLARFLAYYTEMAKFLHGKE